MAENSTTPNRITFSSAGAVRRRPSPQTSGIRESHAELVARLQALPPYEFDPLLHATPDQLQLAADILRCNLRATERYVVAFVRDTADHTSLLPTDRLPLDGLFDDIIGDLCGAIEKACDRAREESYPARRRIA